MATAIQKILKPTKYRAVDTSTGEHLSANFVVDPEFKLGGSDQADGVSGTYWATGSDVTIDVDGGPSGTGCAVFADDSDVNTAVGNCLVGWNQGDKKGYGTSPIGDINKGDKFEITYTVSDYSTGEVRINLFSKSPAGDGNHVNNPSNPIYKASTTVKSENGTFTQTVIVDDFVSSADYNNAIVISSVTDSDNAPMYKVSNISVRKYETFGNNNHGQIYSGRGLEFDGAVDYLTGPTVVEGFTDLSYTKNFTVACWLKIDSLEDAGVWAMGQSTNDRVGLTIGADGEIAFSAWDSSSYTHASGGAEGSKAIEANTWYRVICTMSPTNTKKLYINGVLQTGTSQTFGSPLSSISTQLYIGRTGLSAPGYLGMKMSDFQVWNSTWTQSDVTFDYLNPESLALNNGGTSLTESNLKLWYPMQDGHRGQKSYILDGANAGLGEEMLVNSDMNPSGPGWRFGSNWETSGLNNVLVSTTDANPDPNANENAKYTTFDGKQVMYFKSLSATDNELVDQSPAVVAGTTYKIHIRVWVVQGQLRGWQSNGQFTDNKFQYTTTTGQWEDVIEYLTADDTDSTGFNVGATSGGSVECYIDFVSMKPVNDKHHATTEFLGDDLFDEGVGDYSDSTGAWAAEPGNSVDNNDSALRITFDSDGAGSGTGDDDGARLNLNDAADLKEDLVVGRTYQIVFEYKINQVTTPDVPLQINQGDSATFTNVTLNQTSFTEVTRTFTCLGSSPAIKLNNMNSGDIVHLKNFTLKEVGVASGWTDADQQLDIPQTALQSYNQLAWFEGVNDRVVCNDGFTPGNHTTVSFWVYMNGADGETRGLFDCINWNNSNFRIQANANNKLTVQISSSGATTSYNSDAITMNKGRWIHCAVYVPKESGKSGRIWTNAEQTTYTTSTTMATSSRDINIGYGGGLTQSYLNGMITEVSVWNAVFTLDNIKELYNDGKGLDAKQHSKYISNNGHLTGYWRNNGLAQWDDLAGSNHGVIGGSCSETVLLPAGIDSSRDNQGFIMNRHRTTNSLNMYNEKHETAADIDKGVIMKRVGNPLTETEQEAMTVMVWFKAPDNTQSDAFFNVTTDGAAHLTVQTNGTGRFRWTYEVNGFSGSARYRTASNTFETNKWSFAAFVCDTDIGSDSDRVKCYVGDIDSDLALATLDGTQTGSPTSGMEDNQVWLGGDKPSGKKFTGQMDDFLIYNRILTLDEIKRNFKAGKRSHK